MPVWKHKITEQELEASEDYISAAPAGVWTKIADEGPNEKFDRELREAIENKVDVEDDDGNTLVPKGEEKKKGK